MSGQVPCAQAPIAWQWKAEPAAAIPTFSISAVEIGGALPALLDGPAVAALKAAAGSFGPVRVFTLELELPRPPAVSVATAAAKLRVRSFFFDKQQQLPAIGENRLPSSMDQPAKAGSAVESGPGGAMAAAAARPEAAPPPCNSELCCASVAGHHRIVPPRDVIKLQDRLEYILQPSIESLLAERSLYMPCQPLPFQLQGVAFLYPRQAAILADEMGLGKTMQAITAIRLLFHTGQLRNVLVVCPKALATNWHREFRRWAPELPVMVIQGDQSRRAWQWQLPDVPVRIANYELLCRDRQWLERPAGSPLRRRRSRCRESDCTASAPVQFDLVVLDESQRIKNISATTSQVVRALARKRSWALTGTPVENSTGDLVAIFEFLAPGLLRSDMKPRQIGRAISDYVLRRTKDQVLKQLPPVLYRDAELELTAEQQHTYDLAEREGVLRLTELGQSATISHVFELVLRLKQICNYDPATGQSSKLERLRADLEEVAASGRKAIVFSQWVHTLQWLAERLRDFGPLQYHGRIPAAKREAILARFRDDRRCSVLLISYGAGGVGLNLQFCNYVFLFDRWWNPAVEDQAINRAHRIGAAGPVTVSRFLVLGTIEERIDRILQQKRELLETIFAHTDGPAQLGLTEEELFGLFDLNCPGAELRHAA